jgi:hypothetical protein
MKMNQQHESQHTALDPQPEVIQVEASAQLSRRKFLTRAGAGSLPVIMSLQSGSAWGCVDLTCSPGHSSISNTRSAVASVQTQKNYQQKGFTKPNWSTLNTVSRVYSVDFNDYLLWDYYRGTSGYKSCFYSARQSNKNILCTNMSLSTWLNTVKSAVYTKSGSTYTKHSGVTSNREPKLDSQRVIKPAIWNGQILKKGTPLNHIFPGMTGNLESFASHSYRYIIAAFIGALWERHEEYKLAKNIPNKTICYPEPQVIIDAYKKIAGSAVKLRDMNTLFEYYSTPA